MKKLLATAHQIGRRLDTDRDRPQRGTSGVDDLERAGVITGNHEKRSIASHVHTTRPTSDQVATTQNTGLIEAGKIVGEVGHIFARGDPFPEKTVQGLQIYLNQLVCTAQRNPKFLAGRSDTNSPGIGGALVDSIQQHRGLKLSFTEIDQTQGVRADPTALELSGRHVYSTDRVHDESATPVGRHGQLTDGGRATG